MADVMKNHSWGILNCKGNARKIAGRDQLGACRTGFARAATPSGSRFEAAGGLLPGVKAAAADEAGHNAGLDRRYPAGGATI